MMSFTKVWKLLQSLQVISSTAVEPSEVPHDLELISFFVVLYPLKQRMEEENKTTKTEKGKHKM